MRKVIVVVIGVPDLFDLLTFSDNVSGDEVFEGILNSALEEFEYYNPLVTHLRLYITYDHNDRFEFSSNLEQVLASIIPDDRLEMVPQEITIYGLYIIKNYLKKK
jgi:hypothetical protein